MITVFKNFSDTKKPHYVTAEAMLERIRSEKIKPQIEAIRAETDEKKRRDLKSKLPCILWSGKFTERSDKAIIEHSGLVVLDFDKIKDLDKLKKEVNSKPFVYASFVSPSGDGLKVLVKIPKSIENHRGYYRGLMKIFPTLDPTSINESRICYESIDKDMHLNTNCVEFKELSIESNTVVPKKINNASNALKTNYSKLNIAAEMVRSAKDGEKHHILLKASKLIGGYVAGGIVDEFEAVRVLENEIKDKDVDNINSAKKTIRDGIEYGKRNPISVLEYEKYKPVTRIKTSIPITESLDFVVEQKDIDTDLHLWRTNTYPKGVTTGFPSLDKYFLLKRGNYNVFNGFDNVGKSTFLYYIALLSAMLHNWKWVILSTENKAGTVVKRMIEFYWGKPISVQSEMEYYHARDFVLRHFTIIKNDTMYNFKDALEMASKINLVKHKIDGMLIDPYNALKIDLSDNSKINTHEYHYEAASEMQMFAKLNDICVYLNCHVVTTAMRLGTAPKKADTEGGGKFANKADDFITIHRELQGDNWRQTELHIRKIKEIETGGGYTQADNPYTITMVNGGCGFEDSYGNNPIQQYHGQSKQIAIQPNTNFFEVDKEESPF